MCDFRGRYNYMLLLKFEVQRFHVACLLRKLVSSKCWIFIGECCKFNGISCIFNSHNEWCWLHVSLSLFKFYIWSINIFYGWKLHLNGEIAYQWCQVSCYWSYLTIIFLFNIMFNASISITIVILISYLMAISEFKKMKHHNSMSTS